MGGRQILGLGLEPRIAAGDYIGRIHFPDWWQSDTSGRPSHHPSAPYNGPIKLDQKTGGF